MQRIPRKPERPKMAQVHQLGKGGSASRSSPSRNLPLDPQAELVQLRRQAEVLTAAVGDALDRIEVLERQLALLVRGLKADLA